ncbi:hypothetical protein A7985_07480 [Pseudoalteromonas luteoviolacea]|uniref:Uncharacterized protein n=1 Tax=Pseudoalteromonas luteoviolacea TaxID=43657 RepID=A0A1C0TWS1_9GAMM|nr:hypothetical protein [Pseudoalteromonas luteoviolacea]OCQ23772.1 hypothetical protein A7985_07480 [Pseudoalteromonas luteoviolacea]
MDYDEDQVLTDYVWSHGYNYMTELEQFGQKAVLARFKAEKSSPVMAQKILEQWWHLNDKGVNEALSKGVAQFQLAVRDRVLRDHPEIVNRCPSCKRVVRTPTAKQCHWCFHEWRKEI